MMTIDKKHELDLRNTAKACRAEGAARACKLNKILLDTERYDDLRRMCDDKAYFDKLCTEFGLSYDDE